MISKSNFIHASRWVAAMLVLLSHLRSILFKDYGHSLNDREKVNQLFYFITGLGHQSVIVFFVLSGYLIASSILKQFNRGEFRFTNYLINRISRLYSVLIVALLITAGLDHLGSKFDDIGIYVNHLHFSAINFSVENRSSFMHFIVSLLMLQDIVLPPLGSNGPLWSLNYEFFYYLIFPCLCIPFLKFLKKDYARSGLVYILTGGLLMFLLPPAIKIYFVVWLLGLIPVFLTIRFRLLSYLFPVLLIAFLLFEKTHKDLLSNFNCDLIIGVVFALWLCCFPESNYKGAFYKLNEWLASFSYTLYLVHVPFMLCSLTVLHFYFSIGINMELSGHLFLLFFSMVFLAYAFSYFVASFTEFKTVKFKKIIENVFKIR